MYPYIELKSFNISPIHYKQERSWTLNYVIAINKSFDSYCSFISVSLVSIEV